PPAPVPQAAPTPQPAPPAPKPAPAAPAPAPGPSKAESEEAARRADDQRKAAEANSARRAVDDALNRYRSAFENKDAEALKEVWPSLGRAELNSFQNFFKIARSIRLQLQPLGEPELSARGATVRARRTMAATDERGALPQQDQVVKITLRRAAGAMVIESI